VAEPLRIGEGQRTRWYQQPVAWLGVLVFLASLAGCVWLILVASRYDDDPLPVATEQVFKVPARRTTADPPQAPSSPPTSAAADSSPQSLPPQTP